MSTQVSTTVKRGSDAHTHTYARVCLTCGLDAHGDGSSLAEQRHKEATGVLQVGQHTDAVLRHTTTHQSQHGALRGTQSITQWSLQYHRSSGMRFNSSAEGGNIESSSCVVGVRQTHIKHTSQFQLPPPARSCLCTWRKARIHQLQAIACASFGTWIAVAAESPRQQLHSVFQRQHRRRHPLSPSWPLLVSLLTQAQSLLPSLGRQPPAPPPQQRLRFCLQPRRCHALLWRSRTLILALRVA